MNSDRTTKRPSLKAIVEARLNPGGVVYEIDGEFEPEDFVPPTAIIGAWPVDDLGRISGEFVPNPNYRKPQE